MAGRIDDDAVAPEAVAQPVVTEQLLGGGEPLERDGRALDDDAVAPRLAEPRERLRLGEHDPHVDVGGGRKGLAIRHPVDGAVEERSPESGQT
jgi:hypothetical protein